jgi:hypothetical protein
MWPLPCSNSDPKYGRNREVMNDDPDDLTCEEVVGAQHAHREHHDEDEDTDADIHHRVLQLLGDDDVSVKRNNTSYIIL